MIGVSEAKGIYKVSKWISEKTGLKTPFVFIVLAGFCVLGYFGYSTKSDTTESLKMLSETQASMAQIIEKHERECTKLDFRVGELESFKYETHADLASINSSLKNLYQNVTNVCYRIDRMTHK